MATSNNTQNSPETPVIDWNSLPDRNSIGSRFVNRLGIQYGELTVIRFIGVSNRKTIWECQCSCGNLTKVSGSNLPNGHTTSCGCVLEATRGKSNITHGGTIGNTRGVKRPTEYHIWASMRKRCLNPKCKAYPDYGGRGITICDRWSKFENFLEDMGKRPSKFVSLDRVDTNKGYSPDNCAWRSAEQQMNNKRNNMVVEYKGKTTTLSLLCKELQVEYHVVYGRMNVLGWGIERAINTPKTVDRIADDPIRSKVRGLAERFNVKYTTICNYLRTHSLDQTIAYYTERNNVLSQLTA